MPAIASADNSGPGSSDFRVHTNRSSWT
jgi:hypothetical protein